VCACYCTSIITYQLTSGGKTPVIVLIGVAVFLRRSPVARSTELWCGKERLNLSPESKGRLNATSLSHSPPVAKRGAFRGGVVSMDPGSIFI